MLNLLEANLLCLNLFLIIIPKILIKNLDLNFDFLLIWVVKFERSNLNTQIFKIRLFCSILALRREKMPRCV